MWGGETLFVFYLILSDIVCILVLIVVFVMAAAIVAATATVHNVCVFSFI